MSIVDNLLRKGATVDFQNNIKSTALIEAIKNNRGDTVKPILKTHQTESDILIKAIKDNNIELVPKSVLETIEDGDLGNIVTHQMQGNVS